MSNGAFASSNLTSPFDTQGGPLRRLHNALKMQAQQQMGIRQQHTMTSPFHTQGKAVRQSCAQV